MVIPAANVVIIERNDRVVYRHAPTAPETPVFAKVQPPVPSLRRPETIYREPGASSASRVATRQP